MNAEQKLERIEELLAQRAEINAALIAILEPEETTEDNEVERAPKPGKQKTRKVRSCSSCGKPGHIARKCPGIGSGERNLKEKPDILSEEQFEEMKELQKSGDLSTRIFAAEHGLAITEVNRAIPFAAYETYVG